MSPSLSQRGRSRAPAWVWQLAQRVKSLVGNVVPGILTRGYLPSVWSTTELHLGLEMLFPSTQHTPLNLVYANAPQEARRWKCQVYLA